MTAVWDQVINLEKQLTQVISAYSTNASQHSIGDYTWYNQIYSSPTFRRAHIEIVDFRETHNIYILHSTIFPHYNDPSPIWGFDAVCGPRKITGAFHDFSNGGDPEHVMMHWFKKQSSEFKWKKPRQLPEWAQAIFSPSMIAAGNISEGEELDSLCDIAINSLEYYLSNVGKKTHKSCDYQSVQDYYCQNQKKNPHVVNSMVAMGVPKDIVVDFVDTVLFPESK